MILALLALSAEAKKPAVTAPAPIVFEDVAAELIGHALIDHAPYDELVYLTTRIGNRFEGTPALDRAVVWAKERMTAHGLVNVRAEPATLKSWTRGTLDLQAVAPFARPLHGLSLGGSVGTAVGGIEADVIVVSSFSELAVLPDDRVRGRIVVFDAPFTTYGDTVGYRFGGASEASKRGAVATLVRSITTESLDTPHTGAQKYADGVTPIPVAAITVEDAVWMHRLQDQGVTPRVRFASTAAPGADVAGSNVIGEIPGTEHPEQIVVLACHLDSWDVGQGAQDDGAGCMQVLGAAAEIAGLSVRPRRTIRVVFYSGEEYGIGGSKAYAAAHGSEPHWAAIEADTGSGHPLGFNVDVRAPGTTTEQPDPALVEHTIQHVSAVPTVLRPLAADAMAPGYAGTDIGPLIEAGVPGFGLHHDTTGYWPVHHTWADTIDKVDPKQLNEGVAAIAVLAWVLADGEAPLTGP